MKNDPRQQIYHHLGDLLDYPGPNLADQVRACICRLAPIDAEATTHLLRFLDYVERTPPGQLEEIYTGTFDINPACYIYAGYILFGESFKRGKFLVQLQEKYRERGFSVENELADHLAVLFRFLAILDPDEILAWELIADCLVPVLQAMLANFQPDDEESNPYAYVLRAILNVLAPKTLELAPAPELALDGVP